MTDTNGSTHAPHRVLVVGGDERNVPTWAKGAFEIEHIGGESQKGRLAPKANPEAVVVVVDFVSHNFSGQAHDLGRALSIPVLKARSGWASAVAGAAKNRLDWFVDACQTTGEALEQKNPPQSAKAAAAVDNAWKKTAEYERRKCDAATKRLRDVQTRLDKLEHVLARVRSGAQERVLAEVRRRASELRERQDNIVRPVADEIPLLRRALDEVAGRLDSLEERLRDALRSPSGG